MYLRLLVLSTAGALILLAGVHNPNAFPMAGLAVIVIAVGAWSGLVLGYGKLAQSRSAPVREILMDFVWVFCLVLLSGRSANPFIYYYLVLVAICASIFSPRTAWSFCVAGILAYSSLLLVDISGHFDHMAESYRIHLGGMWLNYVGSSLLTCYFVSRLAKLLREQQTQLAAAREENLKSEQMIGIGTVAASTVHALATPLSTLTVLAEDIANSAVEKTLRDDLALMVMQINRCKQTMKELSTLAHGQAGDAAIEVGELITELEEYFSLNSPGRVPKFIVAERDKQLTISSSVLLQHALINLINNANESEASPAHVECRSDRNVLEILIENDAALSAHEVLQRWGKPQSSQKQAGLGIGSFLANSTIEKLGGAVRLQAQGGADYSDKTHVEVYITLPLETGA